MLRMALVSMLSLAPGCSLARDVTGMADGGPLAVHDAFVPPGVDAFVAASDAFVPPGVDAFVAPIDAYVGPDAFVTPVDAYVAPPDAWAPPTCMEQYGSASNFLLCSSDATSCTFYSDQNRTSCDTVCAAGGGTCLGAVDSNAPNGCTSTSDPVMSDCGTARGDGQCRCTRP